MCGYDFVKAERDHRTSRRLDRTRRNMMPLIFVTGNEHKFAEASAIALEHGLELIQVRDQLVEIQTASINAIVYRKAKDAYERLGRPLFVEHTSLHIEFANGFPGGLTSIFLATLGDDKVCELFGRPGRDAAFGQTTVGYCDGRRVHQFSGILKGRIIDAARGARKGWEQFGWSRIFIPEGYSTTLSELGMKEKNKFSMRRVAIIELVSFLASCK